jgi:hypothetical protein
MPWGGGSYTKGNSATGGWTGDASLGIGIEAGRHDTQDNDFATGINQCLNKDGSNSATANLNIGNFKITNVAAATTRTDAAQVAQVQDGDYIWLGTTAGTATAQTATAAPAITAYKAGQKFRMKVGVGLGSTGNVETTHTLNINSIGTKEFRDNGTGSKPTVGTWAAGSIMEVVYDGTNFVITNDPSTWLSYTPTVTAPGGMTISSVVVNDAVYRKTGTIVNLWLNVSFTTGGTAANSVYITLPVNQVGYAGTTVFSALNFDGVTTHGFGTFFSVTQVQISKDLAGTNFTLGASKFVRFNISYDAV